MKNIVNNQIDIIESSLEWGNIYKKESFPKKEFKEYRRRVKKIKDALQDKCSVAAYGESQVGKSYLMNGLLSSSEDHFTIINNDIEYRFIYDLNPSGGSTSKIESTGVITRFTIDESEEKKGYVRVQNLSITDIILMLTDSYYNDLKINPENSLSSNLINEKLQDILSKISVDVEVQNYIQDDDIRDIQDYIRDVIGSIANNVYSSSFFNDIAEKIHLISEEKWGDIFGLLWNENPHFVNLFKRLINEFAKIKFNTKVYVPFESVLKKQGTLLNVQWLDFVTGQGEIEPEYVKETKVYDNSGNILSENFSKAFLSAFIAEITFTLPKNVAEERSFLQDLDLLDFPGARSRSKIDEMEVGTAMPMILRRGKVAYLFNKYSRSKRITSILFCHHNDQKAEATIGESINDWIKNEIGATPKERAKKLKLTNGISPLFFIATKFNIDLAPRITDEIGNLSNHWARFDKVIPEIITPHTWFEEWVEIGELFPKPYFQNLFLLRDFYWSGNAPGASNLFEGYNEQEKQEEKEYIYPKNFPGYFDELKKSFLSSKFVQNHFSNPEETWKSVATPTNDGSKAIIDAINKIAKSLHNFRDKVYEEELIKINERIKESLEVYFVEEGDHSKNEKIKKIINRVRTKLDFSVAQNAEIFGKIIDILMIEPRVFRKIARDILILHKETPKDFTVINFLRANIGINLRDEVSVNLKKLIDYHGVNTEEELRQLFENEEFEYSVEDIILRDSNTYITTTDILIKNIIIAWVEHINESVKKLKDYIPFTDEIATMFKDLLDLLNVKKELTQKIEQYENKFGKDEILNAIADLSALVLNNFISTVGRKYMSDNQLDIIKQRAEICNVEIDLSPKNIEKERLPQPLDETLLALDKSIEILRDNNFGNNEMFVLRKLPFWDNYQKWKNLLFIGIILSSEVAHIDSVANQKIGDILEKCKNLQNT